MGLGQMRHRIKILSLIHGKDAAGFDTASEILVAEVRAEIEHRHASSAWVNRAAYTKATAIFRIRTIPGVRIDESMLVAAGGEHWVIDSVEQQGRYTVIEAHKYTPEGERRGG